LEDWMVGISYWSSRLKGGDDSNIEPPSHCWQRELLRQVSSSAREYPGIKLLVESPPSRASQCQKSAGSANEHLIVVVVNQSVRRYGTRNWSVRCGIRLR
jgi:hypothetical protein